MQDLAAKVSEVLSVRFQVTLPSSESTPQAVLDSLLDARMKTDRVEGLYHEMVQLRAKTARVTAAIRAETDDRWSQALMDMKSAPSRQRDQYEGPRERYAEADLAVLELKRRLRKSEELLGMADEAVDITKTAFRGLNEIIQDHRTWLRALQFQTYLEK